MSCGRYKNNPRVAEDNCLECGDTKSNHFTEVPLTETPYLHFKQQVNVCQNKQMIMLGIPTTGLIRYEWHMAMTQLLIPVCFGLRSAARPIPYSSPTGYHVAEARNLIVRDFLKTECEWLFFVDHDVLLPPFTYGFLMEYMNSKEYPIVSGLYYAKGYPALPLLFRDRGVGPFMDWRLGDRVHVDGLPMGCTLIHRSILTAMWELSDRVQTRDGQELREVFRTPRDCFVDPETNSIGTLVGTEDLWFLDKVREFDLINKCGWTVHDEKYPYLVDTRLFCKHIDQNGTQYPPPQVVEAFYKNVDLHGGSTV